MHVMSLKCSALYPGVTFLNIIMSYSLSLGCPIPHSPGGCQPLSRYWRLMLSPPPQLAVMSGPVNFTGECPSCLVANSN